MADQLLNEVKAGIQELFQDEKDHDTKKSDHYRHEHPFSSVEKTVTLQEARIFHDSEAVKKNPEKCCTILGQLVYLCQRGELNETEATDVFFSTTKLFVSKDASLRRLVYLFLKEVYIYCDPSDIIIVTSSLTKDMTCDEVLYRANALRVLVRIMDPAMLGAVERYIKSAVVHKSPNVASSALVSSLHLLQQSPENASFVKRWVREVQQTLQSSGSPAVQFQALLLLYQIKQSDRLAVSKLVQQYTSHQMIRSPLALVCLIRYTWKLVKEDHSFPVHGEQSFQQLPSTSICYVGYQFFLSCLSVKSKPIPHQHVMVKYEAARAICSLCTHSEDIYPALDVLDFFLRDTEKPSIQLAAVRTLTSLQQPSLITRCRESLESIIVTYQHSENKLLRTLAMSTLLKTVNPSQSQTDLESLLRQVKEFAVSSSKKASTPDYDDECKMTIISSLKDLCMTNQSRFEPIISTMIIFLKQNGSCDLKQHLVTLLESLMRNIPECSELVLIQLCEFIEDSDYTVVSTRILHIVADIGPTIENIEPSQYIRYLFNRIMLERNMIRAAAVSSLGKFAAACPHLRKSILSLLRYTCQVEHDDETRDRASIIVKLIEQSIENHDYENQCDIETDEDLPKKIVPLENDCLTNSLLGKLPISFHNLECSLKLYQSDSNRMESHEALTLETLPFVEEKTITNSHHEKLDDVSNTKKQPMSKAIVDIPELSSLGKVFRSFQPILLTEKESEYVVSYIKHILDTGIVILQFSVENTLEEHLLKDVTVSLENVDENVLMVPTGEMAANSIKYGEIQNCFVVLQSSQGENQQQKFPTEICTFHCELKFRVLQVDPLNGEEIGEAPYDEEYSLEDIEVRPCDFMAKFSTFDFSKSWEKMGNTHEVLEKYALAHKKIPDAVSAVIEMLGMEPCDGTGRLRLGIDGVPGGKPHILHLSGTYMGGHSVLARLQFSLEKKSKGVVLKIGVRSENSGISRLVVDSIV